MVDSESKFREIEKIYTEVVDRLDATTKLFNDFRKSVDAGKCSSISQNSSVQLGQSNGGTFSCSPNNQMPVSMYQNCYTKPTFLGANNPMPVQIPSYQLSQQSQLSQAMPPQRTSYQPDQMIFNSGQCPIECAPQPVCVPYPQSQAKAVETVTCAKPSCEKIDLGAVEVLILLADGYIQQCEGFPELRECKTKLTKLRTKILTNRNLKPKAITKLMEYVQKVGAEVMKTVQKRSSLTNIKNEDMKENVLQQAKSAKSLNASAANVSGKREKSRSSKTTTRECQSSHRTTRLSNGMEAVSLGKVVPIGKLSDCIQSSEKQTTSISSIKDGEYETLEKQHVKISSMHEPKIVFNNDTMAAFDQESKESEETFSTIPGQQATGFQTPLSVPPSVFRIPQENSAYTPPITHPHSPYGSIVMPQIITNGPSSSFNQVQTSHQQLPNESRQGLPISTQTSTHKQETLIQASVYGQEVQTQRSLPVVQQQSKMVVEPPYSQAITPQASRVHQQLRQTSGLHPEGSQQFVPSVGQVSQATSRYNQATTPSASYVNTQLSAIQSEAVMAEESYNTMNRRFIPMQSQGTQYYSNEFPSQPPGYSRSTMCVKQTKSSNLQNLRKKAQRQSCHHIEKSDEEVDDDCEQAETIIEKLERKSLNIPEGTLVTDGLNVYYILKPNESSDNACSEEVIVNIPIKGSHLVKPTNECKAALDKKCSSCGHNSKEDKGTGRKKSRGKDSKVSDKLLLRLDSEEAVKLEDDDGDYQPENQKKKAKSLSTLADFETCICRDCFPDKEEKVRKVESIIVEEPAPQLPQPTPTVPTIIKVTKPSDQSLDEPPVEDIIAEDKSSNSQLLIPDVEPEKTLRSQSIYSDAMEEFTDATSDPTVEIPPETVIEAKVVAVNSTMEMQRKDALECVFKYLDWKNLLTVSEVCQEWKAVARRPSLWVKLEISNERICAKFLETLSSWCSQVKNIMLQGLKTPRKRKSIELETFLASVEGSLEKGLESILKASQANITTISIIGCSNLFTENILWTISSHCPMLRRLAYVSAHSPAGKESLWGLGSGCKVLDTILLPPVVPCKYPVRFDDECCEVIGRSWPELKMLSIGGEGLTANGLIIIAKLCQSLQFLELDRGPNLTKKAVNAMTSVGLKQLELIELNRTNVTNEAIKALGDGCPKLSRFHFDPPSKTESKEKANSEPTKSRAPSADTSISSAGKSRSKKESKQPRRSRKEMVKLHPATTDSTSISRASTPGYVTPKMLTKEEEEKEYENRLIAAKRLNTETAQKLAEIQKRRKERFAEQQRLVQERLEIQRASEYKKLAGQQNKLLTPQVSRQDRLFSPRASTQDQVITPQASRQDQLFTPRASKQDNLFTPQVSQLSTNTMSTASSRRGLTKSDNAWKEEVRKSNPMGSRLAQRYQEPSNSFYHQSLAEQLQQAGEMDRQRSYTRTQKQEQNNPT